MHRNHGVRARGALLRFPRATLLPMIRREGAQLMRLLLQISGSQDATLAEFANRLGPLNKQQSKQRI